MQRHVALLRGVNVGGRHTLQMKDLLPIFQSAGCSEVETYIQSGNVLFFCPTRLAPRISGVLSQAIQAKAGFAVPVIVRSPDELRAITVSNPFAHRDVDSGQLHVVFLASAPRAERAAKLDPHRSPPDTFALRGKEVFLQLPNGGGQSRLTNAWFDSTLETISTIRSWRTVLELTQRAAG